jgi:predicted RNA-binding Zn ribbon-like protein
VKLPQEIENLELVGGRLAVDFVNTADSATPDGPITDDHIADFKMLMAWAQKATMISASKADRFLRRARTSPSEARRVHREAIHMRAVLYEILRSSAVRRPAEPSTLETFRELERAALRHAHLRWAGERWAWTWSLDDARDLLGPIAHSASELLTSDEVGRLKLCNGCRWLFLDGSKNESRRWCTMAGCGNRAKARRFAARHRS